MSVKRKDRWRAIEFFRETRTHALEAAWNGTDWSWAIWRLGQSMVFARGRMPDEKAAKLAARRAMDRDNRREERKP